MGDIGADALDDVTAGAFGEVAADGGPLPAGLPPSEPRSQEGICMRKAAPNALAGLPLSAGAWPMCGWFCAAAAAGAAAADSSCLGG